MRHCFELPVCSQNGMVSIPPAYSIVAFVPVRNNGTSVFAAHNGRNWRPAQGGERMCTWINSVNHWWEEDIARAGNSISVSACTVIPPSEHGGSRLVLTVLPLGEAP